MTLSKPLSGLLLGMLLAHAYAAEVATPTVRSPVRAQLDLFLHAYNANDRDTFTTYMRDNGSVPMQQEGAIRIALTWYKVMGGFDAIEVTESDPLALTGFVRTRESLDVLGVTLSVEPEPPHRVVTVLFNGDDLPERYLPQRLSDAAAAEAWRVEAARLAAIDKFSGTIYFAHGKNVLARGAFGFADRERKIPNTVETRFRTASVTKMFTAVTVLRLVQDRKISLDEPIGKHVPELANEPLGRGTVHQYLTHTAGAGELFDDRYFGHQRELRSHDDYLRVFGKDLLKTSPGQEFAYSNLGYMLLGSLIERVTGKSWDSAVKKAVFAPARMTRTGTEPEDIVVEGRAIVYDRPLGVRDIISAMDHIDHRPFAACGAYTTVDDLARFFGALRSHRLLNAKYTGLMLTPEG
ncbi:MAG: beta-lactamase family protein, partial [Steroidobacteraceae bacterium]|nr:beta-lactamase family protein [Steroidobacteraceae bacterium]